MKTKLLHQEGEQKTYVIVFDKGDEFLSGLKSFGKDQNLSGSHFTAVGAFSGATLGFFDREKMDYKKIPVGDQVEVLSLVGNIARKGDDLKVHAHVVLGKPDGTALGGHILEAHVWPTLEVVVQEEPKYLARTVDEKTGLALIDLEAAP